jgi:hypothetical protein
MPFRNFENESIFVCTAGNFENESIFVCTAGTLKMSLYLYALCSAYTYKLISMHINKV